MVALTFVLGAVLAWSAAPARSESTRASQAAIDAAINRGVAHLLVRYADGMGRGFETGPPLPSLNDRPGLRALTAYTLLKSGVAGTHPVVEKLIARLALERFDRTYDTACMVLALSALDPLVHKAWIAELAAILQDSRESTGDWGYPGGGDLSNTQYAALALHAASSAGVEVRAPIWLDLARAVLRYQTPEGGFTYGAGARQPTGSMTTAGIGTLAICELEILRAGALPAELEAQLRSARADGLRWLDKHFSVEHNPPDVGWTHYYLYGLERVGALAGIERIGRHDWYAEGAAFLLATQDGAGEWSGTFERSPTLFALLFLRRATLPRGARTGSDGWRAPSTLGTTTPGSVRLEAEGERPLRLWIAGFSSGSRSALEWPGEKGLGMHVLRVDYFADERPIAAVIADEACPAGERRFQGETLLLESGRHRLWARVHVRPPPAKPLREGRPPSPAPVQVLASNVVEIEVQDERANPIATRDPEHGANLLVQAGAKASASSTLTALPAWDDLRFEAQRAIDGNVRSPWIAEAEDREPALHVTLRTGTRANRIRIAAARLVPRSPDVLARPRAISIRVNGGTAQALSMPEDREAWAELVLAKPVVVHTLDVRLTASGVSGHVVGIGEVELVLDAK